MSSSRLPPPPSTAEIVAREARVAEDARNTRDPDRVAAIRAPDSRRRNRAEFFSGRGAIVAFPRRRWARELDHRLIKGIRAHSGGHVAVRSAYEWRDDGDEQWEFDASGLVRRREASIDDVPIAEADRLFRRPAGPRPDGHPGLSGRGL